MDGAYSTPPRYTAVSTLVLRHERRTEGHFLFNDARVEGWKKMFYLTTHTGGRMEENVLYDALNTFDLQVEEWKKMFCMTHTTHLIYRWMNRRKCFV